MQVNEINGTVTTDIHYHRMTRLQSLAADERHSVEHRSDRCNRLCSFGWGTCRHTNTVKAKQITYTMLPAATTIDLHD